MINSFSMPGSASKYKTEGAPPASFLSGVWHGMLLPILFLVSLFKDEVSIYETVNNAKAYHFGYLFGTWGVAGNTFTITIGTSIL